MASIELIPVVGLPEIAEGDNLGELVAGSVQLGDGDIVAISQKAVSKAEGRVRRLAEVEPDDRARELAAELDKDPALVQLILDEAEEVVRAEHGVLITATRRGWVCANSGIDSSNAGQAGAVTLLPVDADASARSIRAELMRIANAEVGVVVADSFGRPWRIGQADIAIGCAGIAALEDWRGQSDRDGRELEATVIAIADEIAAAADLVRSKDSGVPAVVVRGLEKYVSEEDGPGAAQLQRPRHDDLFR